MDIVIEGSIFADILMHGEGSDVKAKALLDSGANTCFCSESFLRAQGIYIFFCKL